MGLSKKTTILLSPRLHGRLRRLARQHRTSLGQLIRDACEEKYGLAESKVRLDAVRKLAALSLPVGSAARMKKESTPGSEDLLP
jgi:hypothetical protein